MDDANVSTSSKILEVLCQISARLEEVDRKLQTVLPSSPALQHDLAAASYGQFENQKIERTYSSFRIRQTQDREGRTQLQEITILGPNLLAVLRKLSSPCGNYIKSTTEETYTFPFMKLMALWDILHLMASDSTPSTTRLINFVCPGYDHEGLRKDVCELINCIELATNCGGRIGERCFNLANGQVRFDDLPTLFAPGALLCSTTDEDDSQVVEVLHCDKNISPVSVSYYQVDYWHFRWNGEAFVRFGGRFEVERFADLRRVTDLPFRPLIISSDVEKSLSDLERVLVRNMSSLQLLKKSTPSITGQYPVFWYNTRSRNRVSSGLCAVFCLDFSPTCQCIS